MQPAPHPPPLTAPKSAPAAPRWVAAKRPWGTLVGAVLALGQLLGCGDSAPGPSHMTLAATWEPAGSLRVSLAHTALVTPQDKARIKEYKVKAALLLNFIKYANFPKSAFLTDESPIEVLVIGKDPFGAILAKTFEKKTLHGRPIMIQRSAKVPKTLDAHLVFAGGLKDKDRAALIKLSKKKPCLLVGDTPGFATAGGFINLYLQKGKVKFEVNADRQEDTGIKLKAELLKLARIVKLTKTKGARKR